MYAHSLVHSTGYKLMLWCLWSCHLADKDLKNALTEGSVSNKMHKYIVDTMVTNKHNCGFYFCRSVSSCSTPPFWNFIESSIKVLKGNALTVVPTVWPVCLMQISYRSRLLSMTCIWIWLHFLLCWHGCSGELLVGQVATYLVNYKSHKMMESGGAEQ